MARDNELFMDFFHKVKHVRSLQKQYFDTRSKAILASAKTHETELDQLIFKIDKKLEARKKVNS